MLKNKYNIGDIFYCVNTNDVAYISKILENNVHYKYKFIWRKWHPILYSDNNIDQEISRKNFKYYPVKPDNKQS